MMRADRLWIQLCVKLWLWSVKLVIVREVRYLEEKNKKQSVDKVLYNNSETHFYQVEKSMARKPLKWESERERCFCFSSSRVYQSMEDYDENA